MGKSNWNNMILLFKIIKKVCPFRMIYSIINIILEKTNSVLFNVLFVKYIIDNLEKRLTIEKILLVFGACGLAQLISKLVGFYYYNIYIPDSNLKIEEYICKSIYNKAQNIDLKNYDDPEIYEKFSLAMSNSSGQIIQIYELIISLLGSLYMVVAIGTIMLTINPILSIFIIIPLLINLIIGKKFNKLHYKYNNEKIKNQKVQNYINKCFFYKEYTLDQKTTEIYNSLFMHLKSSTFELLKIIDCDSKLIAWYEYIYMITSDVIVYLGCIIFSIFSIFIWKILSISECIVIINTLNNMIGALWQLGSLYIKVDKKLLFLENYTEFLNLSNDILDGKEKITDKNSNIIFKDVSFRYTNAKKNVIQHLSFEIPYGQKLAIVGMNGSGKTTLIKLLLRLYDPTDGEIIFDKKNIINYNITEYRNMFYVLFQDYQLYSFALGTNISMDSKFDAERVLKSLTYSGMNKKIMEVDDAINKIVGCEIDTNGLRFSKGERQKLALARLFYNRKDYIVLDEPFSNLDPVAERDIYNNLMKEFSDKTLIVITHKLVSISGFDKIMLIDCGQILEYGSHDELINAKGLYYTMYNKQMDMFEEEKKFD